MKAYAILVSISLLISLSVWFTRSPRVKYETITFYSDTLEVWKFGCDTVHIKYEGQLPHAPYLFLLDSITNDVQFDTKHTVFIYACILDTTVMQAKIDSAYYRGRDDGLRGYRVLLENE